ncbi:hypothetical protein C6P44_002166, partial [Monosporozyma unispora]
AHMVNRLVFKFSKAVKKYLITYSLGLEKLEKKSKRTAYFLFADTLTEDERKITCCFKEVKELFKAYSSGFASTASILADALNPLSKLNFSRQRLENDEEEIKKTFYKISKIFENLLATPVDNDLSSDLVDKVTFDSLIKDPELKVLKPYNNAAYSDSKDDDLYNEDDFENMEWE